MLFNSIDFAIFLPIVFFLYWFVFKKNLRTQNILLVAVSYFFYGWWDYRFLFLLMFSTLLDYYTGIKIHEAKDRASAKTWLLISVVVNLGFLGFFKYYNFFIDSFAQVLDSIGLQANMWSLHIILPVGISFYTFHGLSYVFDVYNKRIVPTRNFVDYAVFVSFFPLLVAGPIERATHLLPQVQSTRTFAYDKAIDGLRQMLWGFFKKIVIADNCATYVNMVFDNHTEYNGSTLFIGAIFFAFQIYGDFSGYSDIALGTARLFGFELLRNFSYPYFSRDIAEFWRRWHISLSSWFRDYLYIPLGGSKVGTWKKIRNTFIIFIVSGFWHGANWTFIVWGILNALYFLPLLLRDKNRTNLDIVAEGNLLPGLSQFFAIVCTFLLTTLAWVFFRANSVSQALEILNQIFSNSIISAPYYNFNTIALSLLIVFFLLIEWIGRSYKHPLEYLGVKLPLGARWSFYAALIFLIILFGGKEQEFIYFQF
jgi:alginate O-acetyltransferase complex protein AlgI